MAEKGSPIRAENYTKNAIVVAPTRNDDDSGWNDDGFTIPAARPDPKDARRTLPGVLEVASAAKAAAMRKRLGNALDDRDLRLLGA